MITLTDLPGLLPPVIAAAETAGRMLTAEFARRGGPRGGGGHAEVDAEIEAELREQLLALLPARWLGEQTGEQAGPGGCFCWLVDPHDGSSAFPDGRRGSRPISQFDYRIALSARAQGACMATRNTGNEEGCRVAVIDPWQKAMGQ